MTRRNSRRSAQEALFAHSPTHTPHDEEKAAERTETTETGAQPVEQAKSHADIIRDRYDIAPNCTNVPRLLYAILCEVVRGRA